MLADQRMQPGHARRALAQPGPGQNPPGLVHQPGIVMISGPVITNQQNCHLRTSRSPWTTPAACGRTKVAGAALRWTSVMQRTQG
jgi:hypothetical protein